MQLEFTTNDLFSSAQELYQGILGASLFRLVNASAERVQQRLSAHSENLIYKKMALDSNPQLRGLGTEKWLPPMTRYTTRAAMRVDEGKPLLRTARQTQMKTLDINKEIDSTMSDREQHDLKAGEEALPFKELLETIQSECGEDGKECAQDDKEFVTAVALVFISSMLNDKFQDEISELAQTTRMAGRSIKARHKSLHRILAKANNKYNGDVTLVLDPVRCTILFRDPNMYVQTECALTLLP